MKITIEPLIAKSWSNIHQYKNCHTDIGTYFLKNGLVYTGFDDSNEEDRIRLEKKLGYDLSPISDFWKTFFIRMTNNPLELDISDAYDELKYVFLKKHKLVADSLQNKKATAEYVIINEEAEATEKNKKAKIRRDAYKAFDKLSNVDIKKALRLYGYKSEHISAEQAEAKLTELVEENPQKFLDIWVNNKDRDTQYLIEAAMSKNVIRKNKSAYMYGTDIIGNTIEDAVAFLNNPKNQEIKRIILNDIEVK